jgi:hypothetical protein
MVLGETEITGATSAGLTVSVSPEPPQVDTALLLLPSVSVNVACQ